MLCRNGDQSRRAALGVARTIISSVLLFRYASWACISRSGASAAFQRKEELPHQTPIQIPQVLIAYICWYDWCSRRNARETSWYWTIAKMICLAAPPAVSPFPVPFFFRDQCNLIMVYYLCELSSLKPRSVNGGAGRGNCTYTLHTQSTWQYNLTHV